MVVALWWSPVDLSTHQQSLIHSPTQKLSSLPFTTQRQFSCHSLHLVCDISYCRPLGQGLLFGATKGNSPHGGGYSVHIGDPATLSLMMQLVLIAAMAGANIVCIISGSGGTSSSSSVD